MDITKIFVTHRDEALSIGDYTSYHHSLTRQLASIRKKLGRATPKNGKYSDKKPVTAEDIGKSHDFAKYLLLSAERAYAHGMSLKASGIEDNVDFPGSTRRQIVSRLNKAAKHAQELTDLLVDQSTTRATDIDLLEAKAYACALSAAAKFERHSSSQRSADVDAQQTRWQTCLKNFSSARVIYAALLKSTKDEMYKDLLVGTIDPSIRIAAYQAHVPRTVPVVTVTRKYFPEDEEDLMEAIEAIDPAAFEDTKSKAGEGAANIPKEIEWRSRKASIVDAAIGQALAAVSTAESKLTSVLSAARPEMSPRDKAAAYDEVLIAAQDAADAARHAIEEHEKEKIPEADPRMQDLRVTNLAVNYDLVGWRIGRNRVLIGDDDGARLAVLPGKKLKRERKDGKEWISKPEGNGRKLARLRERTALYDAILQSIDAVKDVPGAVRDAAFIEELDGKRAYFQALKCLNIAISHALVYSHRNALALLLRATTLSNQAMNALASSFATTSTIAPKLDIELSSIKSLQDHLKSLTLHHHALVELQTHTENSAIAAKKYMSSEVPVVERLSEYPASGYVDLDRIVEWPPRLKAVPAKPLFLDTAWNYIEYPGRSAISAPDAKATGGAGKIEEQVPKKKGWGLW
ncbi:hypothetical protein FKW77_000217 [Venturia effusa]|uniref:Signal recognition particle subunit SRP68 n=1 Tax=Venturia effusa TaxID=50376 RepID=A0A517L8F3_9PEZI|nr:hypothetical protein FKW77_000217 [Venturia effusa]